MDQDVSHWMGMWAACGHKSVMAPNNIIRPLRAVRFFLVKMTLFLSFPFVQRILSRLRVAHGIWKYLTSYVSTCFSIICSSLSRWFDVWTSLRPGTIALREGSARHPSF